MRRVLAALVLAVLIAPIPATAQSPSARRQSVDQLRLFQEAFDRIRRDAVEPAADAKLIGAAIAGMLAGLDARSAYFSEAELSRLPDPAADTDLPLGLALTISAGEPAVISPRDGSPAAAAGIEPGDVITAIDDEPTVELSLGEAEQKLRAPGGAALKLSLRRAGREFDIAVERRPYRLETVSSRLDGGEIGYVRLAGFDGGTAAALEAALKELRQAAGNRLIGLILDLRNNPGGAFNAAVASANTFIDKGDIAVVKGRDPGDVRHIAASPGDLASGLPIVALVNRGTAREAELVAGALQDDRRAVLLGTRTFGDSAIESLVRLPGHGAVRLATARFLTPTGRTIQGKGLEPDLTVAPRTISKIEAHDFLREAELPGALKNPETGAAAEPAAQTAPATGSGHDEQLIEAEDVLRGLATAGGRAAP